MPHHRRHRIVFVSLRIIGKTLADFIDRQDMKPFRQRVEVQTPIVGAVGSVVGAEVAAVKQYDSRAAASFEVAGADAVNVDEIFIGHKSSLRSESQVSKLKIHSVT